VPRQAVRVREVIIGDSRIRLISKRNHPQPNRASILRQAAAASSSTSSCAFSSINRSAAASPAVFHRKKSTVARNLTAPPILVQGPFAKEYRKSSTYSKRKPTCPAGKSFGRRTSPDAIKSPFRVSRTNNYQTTRTFLVDSSINSPGVSRKRRSVSSVHSPTKRNRPIPEEGSAGKRAQKELRPTFQQRYPRREFFIQNLCSRQMKSGDDVRHRHNQPQLSQRKSVAVHRTATRTLVARDALR